MEMKMWRKKTLIISSPDTQDSTRDFTGCNGTKHAEAASVILLRISGTNSQEAAGLLRPSAASN